MHAYWHYGTDKLLGNVKSSLLWYHSDAYHFLVSLLWLRYHISIIFISTIGNWVAEKYIPGTVGSVLGAAFVSLGGSVYAWWCNGYAFAAMVPGVLILVPVSHEQY